MQHWQEKKKQWSALSLLDVGAPTELMVVCHGAGEGNENKLLLRVQQLSLSVSKTTKWNTIFPKAVLR